MGNYTREYVKEVNRFLSEEHSESELNKRLSEHLIKISFIQHERFIHLIVTVLFAIMTLTMLTVSFFTVSFSCVLLLFLFTILLIPYIFHYYFLENSVQKMYKQYDELKARLKKVE